MLPTSWCSGNVRSPCGAPGCEKTFCDPSNLSRHRRDVHGGGAAQRRRGRYDSAITLASANPPASSHALSTSTYLFHQAQSSRGGFHRTTDVPPDCRSTDLNIQMTHQAFNANPKAAPTASVYYSNVPLLSNPPEVVVPHPQPQKGTDIVQSDHGQASMDGDWCSLTLPPRRDEERRGEPLPPFRYPRTGHVYDPSDHRPTLCSSAYLRPNPGMLFDSEWNR
jgi:hypothetical protein